MSLKQVLQIRLGEIVDPIGLSEASKQMFIADLMQQIPDGFNEEIGEADRAKFAFDSGAFKQLKDEVRLKAFDLGKVLTSYIPDTYDGKVARMAICKWIIENYKSYMVGSNVPTESNQSAVEEVQKPPAFELMMESWHTDQSGAATYIKREGNLTTVTEQPARQQPHEDQVKHKPEGRRSDKPAERRGENADSSRRREVKKQPAPITRETTQVVQPPARSKRRWVSQNPLAQQSKFAVIFMVIASLRGMFKRPQISMPKFGGLRLNGFGSRATDVAYWFLNKTFQHPTNFDIVVISGVVAWLILAVAFNMIMPLPKIAGFILFFLVPVAQYKLDKPYAETLPDWMNVRFGWVYTPAKKIWRIALARPRLMGMAIALVSFSLIGSLVLFGMLSSSSADESIEINAATATEANTAIPTATATNSATATEDATATTPASNAPTVTANYMIDAIDAQVLAAAEYYAAGNIEGFMFMEYNAYKIAVWQGDIPHTYAVWFYMQFPDEEILGKASNFCKNNPAEYCEGI